MCFRRLTDIRTTSLLVGMISLQWSLIPLYDVSDRTLFSKVLAESSHETVWMACMFTIGLALIVSSVCKWRGMLLLAEALGTIFWLGLWALFIREAPIAPVVMSFPLFAGAMFLCLVREVVFGCRVMGYREAAQEVREVRGISDMRT